MKKYSDVIQFVETDCSEWMDLNVIEVLDNQNVHVEDIEGYKYSTKVNVIKNSIKRGGKISKFFRGNEYTVENIRRYIELNNIEYSLVSKFVKNAKEDVKWTCGVHGEFEKSWNQIKNGDGCRDCGYISAASKNRNSYEHIANTFECKGLILVSNKYINNIIPLDYICKKHKESGIQSVSFGNLLTKDCVCTYCNKEDHKKRQMKSHSQFVREVEDVHGGDYDVLGEYKGSNTHINLKCNKCSNVWSTKASHILSGHGCPACCSRSKGEDSVREYLIANDITFKEEYRISECRYIKPLPFDFAIFEDCELISLIEFDGSQHYNPYGFGGNCEDTNVRNFELQQIRDGIKDKYCKNNNIPLLRIPYWEINNIDTILSQTI